MQSSLWSVRYLKNFSVSSNWVDIVVLYKAKVYNRSFELSIIGILINFWSLLWPSNLAILATRDLTKLGKKDMMLIARNSGITISPWTSSTRSLWFMNVTLKNESHSLLIRFWSILSSTTSWPAFIIACLASSMALFAAGKGKNIYIIVALRLVLVLFQFWVS